MVANVVTSTYTTNIVRRLEYNVQPESFTIVLVRKEITERSEERPIYKSGTVTSKNNFARISFRNDSAEAAPVFYSECYTNTSLRQLVFDAVTSLMETYLCSNDFCLGLM